MKVVYYQKGPNYLDGDPPDAKNYAYCVQPSNSPVVQGLDECEWLVPGTFDENGDPIV